MYSDMSKRTNSTPSAIASCRVTSVLPTPVGPGEQEAADRLALVAEPGARHLDRRPPARRSPRPGRRSRASGCARRFAQHVAVRCRDVLRRDARDARDDVLDLRDGRPSARARPAGFRRRRAPASSIDVDRLVGQLAVVDVARGELGRGDQRLVGVAARRGAPRSAACRPAQDLDRLGDRSARRRRSSGSAAPARGPSRRCRGIPGRWSSRCSAARRSRARA